MKTLLIVDMQNDFMPWGALPVKDADKLVPLINRLMPCFDLVIATQDWHPADHKSFAENHTGKHVGDIILLQQVKQRLWPVHCVQNSIGAQLVKGLNLSLLHEITQKGTNPDIDSYSAFFDNAHLQPTNLAELLQRNRMKELHICGVATDYCVKFTALDAISLGFQATVILDACEGVFIQENDLEETLAILRSNHVKLAASSDYLHDKI